MMEWRTNPNSGTPSLCPGSDGNFVQIFLPNRRTAGVLPVVLWAVDWWLSKKMSSLFVQLFHSVWAARMVFSVVHFNRTVSVVCKLRGLSHFPSHLKNYTKFFKVSQGNPLTQQADKFQTFQTCSISLTTSLTRCQQKTIFRFAGC